MTCMILKSPGRAAWILSGLILWILLISEDEINI